MKHRSLACAVALATALAPLPASAGASARYALVLGNNSGGEAAGELAPLEHAERDARLLYERLLSHGNFAPERVILLTGAGRAEILEAAERLADRVARDQHEHGTAQSLFALFFTGHGVDGSLLTADAPLSAGDVAAIFRQVGASLTVGFFDACYSGSLDLDQLRMKGARVLTGFNPLRELPREVLNSEGTLWFASSQPGEVSYEDKDLGGLFTHYFADAFVSAPNDGVGVTLDDMWEYASARTREHARRYGRTQTPQQLIRRMKSQGPIYFSFPVERSATLHLGASVEGTFVIEYTRTGLIERLSKSRGAPLDAPMFPGSVRISRLDAPGSARDIEVAPGDRVSARLDGERALAAKRGWGEAPLRGKGELPGVVLQARAEALTWSGAAGYRLTLLPEASVGAPHGTFAELGMSFGGWGVAAELGAGASRRRFAVWAVSQRELGAGLRAARSLQLGPLELELGLRGAVTWSELDYDSGSRRAVRTYSAAAGARLLLPLPWGPEPWIFLAPEAAVALRSSEGLARLDTARYRQLAPQLGLVALLPL